MCEVDVACLVVNDSGYALTTAAAANPAWSVPTRTVRGPCAGEHAGGAWYTFAAAGTLTNGRVDRRDLLASRRDRCLPAEGFDVSRGGGPHITEGAGFGRDIGHRQPPGPLRNIPVPLVTVKWLKRACGPYAGVMKIFASNDGLNRMALCVCLLSTPSIARSSAQGVPVPPLPESFDMDTFKTASVLVAVTEYNGGWAFQCELHPIGGKARK